MTFSLTWSIIMLLSAGCAMQPAGAPPAPAPEAPEQQAPFEGNLTADSPIDHILEALDARGRDLRSLAADVTLIEADAALGDQITRTGSFALEMKPDGSARSRVTFDTRQADNRITKEKIEYLLDGPNLIDRTHRTKIQVTRQVLRPGEKLNLLKLGEGPFPLPIGQEKEEVHRLFEVKKIEPQPDDPPNSVHVQLVPRPGSQFAGRFQSIDAWVDLNDHMPKRIETFDANGTTVRTTELSNVRVNAELGERAFALEKIGPDWTQLTEAFQE